MFQESAVLEKHVCYKEMLCIHRVCSICLLHPFPALSVTLPSQCLETKIKKNPKNDFVKFLCKLRICFSYFLGKNNAIQVQVFFKMIDLTLYRGKWYC